MVIFGHINANDIDTRYDQPNEANLMKAIEKLLTNVLTTGKK